MRFIKPAPEFLREMKFLGATLLVQAKGKVTGDPKTQLTSDFHIVAFDVLKKTVKRVALDSVIEPSEWLNSWGTADSGALRFNLYPKLANGEGEQIFKTATLTPDGKLTNVEVVAKRDAIGGQFRVFSPDAKHIILSETEPWRHATWYSSHTGDWKTVDRGWGPALITPDSRYAVIFNDELTQPRSARRLDLKNGELGAPREVPIGDAEFSADGKTLFISNKDGLHALNFTRY